VAETTCPLFGVYKGETNGKSTPIQAWAGPYGFMRLRLLDFLDNRHMKVVRLLALRTGRLYPPGTHFCSRLST